MKLTRVLAGAVLLPLAGLGVATALTRRRGDAAVYPPKAGEETIDVFIVRNWLHANLVAPTAALGRSGPVAQALDALPVQAPYVMLGWGDAKHFRERGHTPLRALDLWRSFLVPGNP